MKLSKILALILLVLGFALQTYIALFKTSELSYPFWLWTLSPYLVGAVLLLWLRQPYATVGALVIPLAFDICSYHSIFISPQHSTAALGLLFIPLWNLFVFVPFGGFIGWWIDKRRQAMTPANQRF